MNFQILITEILERGYTLREIAEKTGLSSAGHVHDIKTGRQAAVSFEAGDKLRKLHQSAMRRKVR